MSVIAGLLGLGGPHQSLKLHVVPGRGPGKQALHFLLPAQDPLSLGVLANVGMGSTGYYQYFQNLKEIAFLSSIKLQSLIKALSVLSFGRNYGLLSQAN